jgi:hypothetical protein
MIWLIDEVVTCLTIFCIQSRLIKKRNESRENVSERPEASFELRPFRRLTLFLFLSFGERARVKNGLEWQQKRKLIENDSLLGNFMKNYMSSRSACVVQEFTLFPFPPSSRKNLSRTRLWKRQISNYTFGTLICKQYQRFEEWATQKHH